LLAPSLCFAQLANQLSDNKDDTPIIIEADESVVCDETALKCVATGLASAQKGTSTVYGDVLTVYFTEGKKSEITSMTADGHVRMETPTEKAFGEHAHYDVALDRVIMTGGNLKIETEKGETLTARDSLEYYHTDNKGIARGHAIAVFPEKEQLVQADTLVAYFKSSPEKSEDGKDKTSLEKVEAEGNMLASGPNGIVTGDRGVYLEKTKIVEVFNNVKITQEENVIEGEYAKFNMDTNVAEMYTQPPHVSPKASPKRIHGMIFPKNAKREKSEGKDRQPLAWSVKKREKKSSQAE
jgi:lipopolysaccharide export system protein LptA